MAALGVLGYAAALALTPAGLGRWFWVAVPLLGLVVAALGLGWLVLALPGGVAGGVLLAAAVVAALLATRRGWRPPAGQAWREQAAVAVLAALAAGTALAPLVARPELVAIGPNWDIEIYLPMAAYLRDAPLGFGLGDPAGFPFPGYPNPLLWRVNFFDPRWSGLTFQELHAALSGLTGLPPHATFTGLLAALFALLPPAGFLLARCGLRAGAVPALGAALLLALGTPGLFVIYWSFGQQAAALPLLPLGVVALLLATAAPDGRARWLVALTAAALAATYVPAAPVYVAAAGCVAAGGLATPGRRSAAVAAVATAAAGVALLAPWAVLRTWVRAWYFLADAGLGGLTVGPDVTDFPPLGWGFGLYPSPGQGLAGVFPVGEGPGGVRFALLAMFSLGAVHAWRQGNRSAALLSLAPALVLLPLRYLAPYPYGYMKSVPFTTPLLLGMAVLGGAALWQWAGGWIALRRAAVALGGVLLVAATASSAWHYAREIRHNSPMAFRPVEGLAAAVPPGARVYVSGHRSQWGPTGGALAYALTRADLYGYMSTGFSTFYRPPDGALHFALFAEGEHPWREVFGDGPAPVWAGLGQVLYRVPPDLAAYVDLGAGAPPVVQRSGGRGSASGLRIADWTPEGYPEFQGWSPPLLGTLAEVTPPEVRYPMVAQGVGHTVAPPEVRGGEQARLALATFQRQTLSVRVGDRTATLDVPAGLSSHNLGRLGPGQEVTVLDNGVEAPVWVRSLSLWRAPPPPGRAYPQAVLVAHNARLAGASVVFTVAYSGPALQPVIDVYSEDGTVHYGYWVLSEPRAGQRTYRLRLDTREQEVVPQRRDGSLPLQGYRGEAPDGDYRMYLMLWRDGQLVDQVSICTFRLQGKRAIAVTPEPGRLYVN